MKRILITGAAGFIGAFLCKRLLRGGYDIVGIDNVNGYYDPGIKLDRLRMLAGVAGGERAEADPQGFSCSTPWKQSSRSSAPRLW